MSRDNIARGLAVGALRGRVLGQSAVAVSHTGDTAEFTFATITIPANAMGANGVVKITSRFSASGTAASKTIRIKLGGSVVVTPAVTSTLTEWAPDIMISNRNAANSQRWDAVLSDSGGARASQGGTLAVDTTASVDITITGQLTNGADTITLESYQVVLYPMS